MSDPSLPTAPAQAADNQMHEGTVWALVADRGAGFLLSGDGEVERLAGQALDDFLRETPVLVAHGPFLARRLGLRGLDTYAHFDLSELFAFLEPARYVAPSPTGYAHYLGLPEPQGPEGAALTLLRASEALLAGVSARPEESLTQIRRLTAFLNKAGWPWAPFVAEALPPEGGKPALENGLEAWRLVDELDFEAPPPRPGDAPVSPAEAQTRLADVLETMPQAREPRPGQKAYAGAAAAAFTPAEAQDQPGFVLAEAGTGTGKTLGYLAPAHVWLTKNGRGVWVSTYTKALQRQLARDVQHLFPTPEAREAHVAIRKGRENYLCLLNYQDAVRNQTADPVSLALVARWIGATQDGDMVGGDFPGWLTARLTRVGGGKAAAGYTDRRGECLYAACQHYRRCFIEKATRRAARADLVIANHAVLLVEAQRRTPPDPEASEDDEAGGDWPFRHVVFDEGHHLFDAADSAFTVRLTNKECADLHRWISGVRPSGPSGRQRGLMERAYDLVNDDDEALEALTKAIETASVLPVSLPDPEEVKGAPLLTQGSPGRRFFAAVATQVLARQGGRTGGSYDLEAEIHPASDELKTAALDFAGDLEALEAALRLFQGRLGQKLVGEMEELEAVERMRLQALVRTLEARVNQDLPAWRGLLATIADAPQEAMIDRLVVERFMGRMVDVGALRHPVDPMGLVADRLIRHTQGTLITSATLNPVATAEGDRLAGETPLNDPTDWSYADRLCGAGHLSSTPKRLRLASPFDYARQALVLIVTDVDKREIDETAAALESLIRAVGGGTLGLFTAIARVRAVFERLCTPLEADGLPLYAQHVDAVDPGTLMDVFREEPAASLIGTDTLREGLDVPGPSLRQVILDRVPWPVPSLTHKARRDFFGGKTYDEALTRLRLAQGFGRLIRSQTDRGVCVVLDRQMPSRLLNAFPPSAPVHRVGIAEAIDRAGTFLSD